jgi:hypothetical protein
MAAITDGIRLEPGVRRVDSSEGLQARIRDPLWLLARQWQFGEFAADDAGSPARVDLDGESARLTRYRLGPLVTGDATPFSAGSPPVETLVEREPLLGAGSSSTRVAAEAGMQFVRGLDAAGVGAYISAYRSTFPLQPPAASDPIWSDPDSRLFMGVVGGRIPDGNRLYASLSAAFGPRGDASGALPTSPPVAPADAATVTQVARAWLAWYADQGVSQPQAAPGGGVVQAWKPERMEYEFAVGARLTQGEIVLTAPEYFEGRLDWTTFVVNPSVSLGSTADGQSFGGRVLPAPVSFRGMPASRFWEFEDARINLSDRLNQVSGEPLGRDIARFLLLEFALQYGNDWFVIPVELAVGSLSRVRSLVVTDTFGVQTTIPHTSEIDGPNASWRMFNLSLDNRAAADASVPAGLFLLAPALGQSLEGPVLEEVLFLRDEMANLAWALERVVESPLGQPVDRTAAVNGIGESAVVPAEADEPATWAYHLASDVPDYWIPFAPGQPGWLQRVALPNRAGQPIGARGRILEPQRPDLRVYDEEIPREGARVRRAYQYARWIDGSSYLWIGRRKSPGRGEGSSGLRFDVMEPRRAGPTDLAEDAPRLVLGARATLGVDALLRRLVR